MLFWTASLSAQFTESGLPLALDADKRINITLPAPATLELPPLDVRKAAQEDAETPGQNRFAAPLPPLDISTNNAGEWYQMPNGDRIWQCRVQSKDALGLVLLLDQLRIPPGGRLFIYEPEGRQRFGAYTAQSLTNGNKLTVGPIAGESAIIELIEPAGARGQAGLRLFRVDYAYRPEGVDQAQVASFLGFGMSQPCNVNVNCPPGANWQTQKQGMARILMVFSNGTGWCSGSLVANTAGNYDPYFLSAHHCQIIGQNPSFDMWRFDFDYESQDCANPATEPALKSVLGCERISFRMETDFMLLKLNPIPVNYGLYFNGWTRSATPATGTTFTHHPAGDIMKISVDTNDAVIHPTTIAWGGAFGTSPVNTHWRVIPQTGTFQPGSSGCPLFDQNKRIVGQLHGGNVAANGCTVQNSYFGRFDLSWNAGSSAQSRLREWLDPGNTDLLTQNGYEQPIPTGYAISGQIKSYLNVPMRGVPVKISGGAVATVLTDTLGNFIFENIPSGGIYVIQPEVDTNYLNGVSTFDLALISKHILSVDTLDSPWKLIAGDVNRNSTLTATDIVEIRKLVLGLVNKFPNARSWRFFPDFISFSNPAQPFLNAPFPEQITINNLQGNYPNVNFIGLKMGDVNDSAVP